MTTTIHEAFSQMVRLAEAVLERTVKEIVLCSGDGGVYARVRTVGNYNDRDPLAEATHGPTVDVAIEKMIARLTAMAETRRAALDAALDAGRTAAAGQSDDSDEEP